MAKKFVYMISNDHGFLSKTLTPKGKPRFFEPSKMDKVWITDDKVEAEDKLHELTRKGYINKYRFGDGIVEVENDDGMYDEFLPVK